MKKHHIAFALLFIFYTVGILGLSIPALKDIFLRLTPANLLLTLVVLTWGHQKVDYKLILAFLFAFLVGFLVEVAGVHTGLLFGEYTYGDPLGWRIFDVPLIIGVNWFLLAYASKGAASIILNNKWLQWGLAALIMVLLDFFIEPVAIELDFWDWTAGHIPIRNYFMWFITAFVVHMGFGIIGFKTNKRLALVILLIQFYFFIALNLLYWNM